MSEVFGVIMIRGIDCHSSRSSVLYVRRASCCFVSANCYSTRQTIGRSGFPSFSRRICVNQRHVDSAITSRYTTVVNYDITDLFVCGLFVARKFVAGICDCMHRPDVSNSKIIPVFILAGFFCSTMRYIQKTFVLYIIEA